MNTQFAAELVQERIPGVSIVKLDALENAGGFSGAKIWKVETDVGSFCVRRWPKPHPSKERLSFIHEVLFHLEYHGFQLVAAPRRSQTGDSWTEYDAHFWEVTTWLPGKSDFWLDASEIRLRNAMSSLGRFHAISKKQTAWRRLARSPGISHRIQRLREIEPTWTQRLMRAIETEALSGFQSDSASRIRSLCQLIATKSSQLADPCLGGLIRFDTQHELSPCLRDIWHDHVLFREDQVTGIIDYGALNIDVPAGDFARLLGSLALDDARFWEIGCDAIQQALPEMRFQIPLIKAIDFANVVLAGLNWINWLFIEKREFPIHSNVIARLDHIHRRLAGRFE